MCEVLVPKEQSSDTVALNAVNKKNKKQKKRHAYDFAKGICFGSGFNHDFCLF